MKEKTIGGEDRLRKMETALATAKMREAIDVADSFGRISDRLGEILDRRGRADMRARVLELREIVDGDELRRLLLRAERAQKELGALDDIKARFPRFCEPGYMPPDTVQQYLSELGLR